MTCLDNIVTLGICPDDAASLSGFQLINAAGISPKVLDNIANENYVQGAKLAMAKKQVALNQFRNDFIGVLQANKVVTTISEPVYDSSIFNPATSMGTFAGERGITLHRNTSYRGRLRSIHLKNIQVYPLASGDATIKIYDGHTETSFPVTLVANQLNTFSSTYVMPEYAHSIRILIDNTEIPMASAKVICGQGCNGTMPNPCGYVKGWDGTQQVKGEGYGINAQFYCHCNYDQVLCDLATSYSGELIWLKWQYNIYEEQWKTNRFNYWVIYNRDEIPATILPELEQRYNKKWNQMMDGLLEILKTYRDDCLNCRGIRWNANI